MGMGVAVCRVPRGQCRALRCVAHASADAWGRGATAPVHEGRTKRCTCVERLREGVRPRAPRAKNWPAPLHQVSLRKVSNRRDPTTKRFTRDLSFDCRIRRLLVTSEMSRSLGDPRRPRDALEQVWVIRSASSLLKSASCCTCICTCTRTEATHKGETARLLVTANPKRWQKGPRNVLSYERLRGRCKSRPGRVGSGRVGSGVGEAGRGRALVALYRLVQRSTTFGSKRVCLSRPAQ